VREVFLRGLRAWAGRGVLYAVRAVRVTVCLGVALRGSAGYSPAVCGVWGCGVYRLWGHGARKRHWRLVGVLSFVVVKKQERFARRVWACRGGVSPVRRSRYVSSAQSGCAACWASAVG